MGGTRRVLYEIAQAPQTVVENLLGHHVVFCRAPVTLPVMGVIRLTFQLNGSLTRILQATSRNVNCFAPVVDL